MSESGTSQPVPFVLLGETRRAALGQVLTGCMESWRSSWSTANDAINVQIRAGDGLRHVADCPLLQGDDYFLARSVGRGALLKVHASAEFLVRLVGVDTIAAGSSAVRGELVRELRKELLQSLCSAVVTRAGVNDASVEAFEAGPSSAELPMTRSLTVGVTLGASRAALHLVLNPILVDLLAPIPRVARSSDTLSPRRGAIAEETVRVEAVLGDVEITLSDLAHLTEGDVIVLDQSLRQPGHLFTEEGRRVASIVLGRSESHRAVSVAR